MKIKITKDEAVNFVSFCSKNGVSDATVRTTSSITYILVTGDSDVKAQFVIGKSDHPEVTAITLKSPGYFIAALSNTLKNKDVELNITKSSSTIEFDGYKFVYTPAAAKDDDGDAPDESDSPAPYDYLDLRSDLTKLVRLGMMKKSLFEKNFKDDFMITYSNCFVKSQMMGVLLSAKDEKIVKANPGSMLYEIGKFDADFASETFASHDSPIAHSRAACIFTEQMYNIVDSMNFDRLNMFIPLENRDKKIGFTIDEKTFIIFSNVYVPGTKELEHYVALSGESEDNAITLPKSVIKSIVDAYILDGSNSDTFVDFNSDNGFINVVIDDINQAEIKSKEIKVEEQMSASLDLNTMKFLSDRIAGDSITLLFKRTDVFSGESGDKKAYFNIHDGDNEYFFKAGNE